MERQIIDSHPEKKKQLPKLMDALDERGSVTGMDCINMGIMNYKGRIADLRKLGVDIETVMVSDVNGEGEKIRYARYYLRRA